VNRNPRKRNNRFIRAAFPPRLPCRGHSKISTPLLTL
jgi:hypothetical protein